MLTPGKTKNFTLDIDKADGLEFSRYLHHPSDEEAIPWSRMYSMCISLTVGKFTSSRLAALIQNLNSLSDGPLVVSLDIVIEKHFDALTPWFFTDLATLLCIISSWSFTHKRLINFISNNTITTNADILLLTILKKLWKTKKAIISPIECVWISPSRLIYEKNFTWRVYEYPMLRSIMKEYLPTSLADIITMDFLYPTSCIAI
jgi:hypothetical protein